jgi:hypothetical protein
MIYCGAWTDNKKWKEIEVASDFSVYPCCKLHASHQLNNTYFDKRLDAMDKDWNNLKHNKLKDILATWRQYINWKDNTNTPGCCNFLCGNKETIE